MRRIAALFLVGSGMALAQSTLPITRPTTLPAPAPIVAAPATPSVETRPSHPATVLYIQGQLEITADNSSLNQILREISRLTGMVVTGGVVDQRVFGKYGPARPAEILGSLLTGTGSNMLLRENAANAPAELILTPRQGGPTPPNPNVRAWDDDPAPGDTSGASVQPNQPPAAGSTEPSPQAPAPGRFAAMPWPTPPSVPAGAATDSGANPPPPANPPSPNGVLTPQQIYEQLQRLQQTQAQPRN